MSGKLCRVLEVHERLSGTRPRLWCWYCRRFTEHRATRTYGENRFRLVDTLECLTCGRGKHGR